MRQYGFGKGVVKEMGKLSRVPGRDFFTTGTDWGIDALKRVASGDILGAAGGHVSEIAWILLILNDHYHGFDFSSDVYLNEVSMLTQRSATSYLHHFSAGNWGKIDFSAFSKIKNPALKKYRLNFEAIMNSLE